MSVSFLTVLQSSFCIKYILFWQYTWLSLILVSDGSSFCNLQVDARILRAVAIEHPKDVDLAAGIVLNEIIPLMSKRSLPLATPPQDKEPGAVTNVEGTLLNLYMYHYGSLPCLH